MRERLLRRPPRRRPPSNETDDIEGAAVEDLSSLSMRIAIFPADSSPPSFMSSVPASSSNFVVWSKKKEPSNSKGSDQAPLRITSNVKQSLRILKLWKEAQKEKTSAPRPTTSYRKKKVVKEQVPEEHDLYEDPTMKLHHSNQGRHTGVPVLLVDGYNVCGYWDKLKEDFMNGRLHVARQTLIDSLISFKAFRGVKVVVVFDAMFSGLPTHKETNRGIDVVFSGETSADTWIEREVAALKEDGCPRIWVATSDSGHRLGAYWAGAIVWSCERLISEIQGSREDSEQILQGERSTSMQGRLLQHNLDAKVVQALKDLRGKLENEST